MLKNLVVYIEQKIRKNRLEKEIINDSIIQMKMKIQNIYISNR